MEKGDFVKRVNTNQSSTAQPPARYSEATLIKTLEENGVGRPIYLRTDHWDHSKTLLC